LYVAECGNGVVDPGEECNEPGLTCGSGESCNNATCSCVYSPVCGNGILDPGEECDDGNNSNNDGCFNDCTLYVPACGNGTIDA
jgi:cysteine-rich repeat protein